MSKNVRNEKTKKRIDDSVNMISMSLESLDRALKELSELMLSLNKEEQESVIRKRERNLILKSLRSSVEEAHYLFNIPDADTSREYVR
jgi:hypothetical protein